MAQDVTYSSPQLARPPAQNTIPNLSSPESPRAAIMAPQP